MTMPAQFPALQQRGLAKFIKLALDFSANEVLDPRITFSRTSNATRVNAQGLIEYAPHNLLTYSENFDNAVWGVSGGVVAPNSTISPSGEITADTLTENVGSTDPRFAVIYSFAVGVNYALSVYAKVKPGSSPRYLMLVFNSGYATPCGVNFDLSVGAVGTSRGATGYITQLADGWYRCSMVPASNAIGGGSLRIRMAAVNTAGNITGPTPYTGDGTSGIYLWGAQLNIDSLQPYYTTSVKNLLDYSQNFENAAWTKSNSSVLTNLLTYSQEFDNVVWTKTRSNITANVITAPDGTTTADKFIDDGSIVGQGYISQNYTYTASPYVFSFYAKAGEVTSLRCYLVDSIGIVSASNAIVDLVSGTVTSGSAVVTNAGVGWYRIAVTGVPTAGAGSVRILQPTDTSTTNGFYIWGAQLVQGTNPEEYTVTTSAPAPIQVMGPLGFLGAEKLVENTSTGVPHGLAVDTNSLSSTTQYTLSVYAKAGERTWVRLGLVDNLGTDGGRAWYDLSTGVVGTVETNGAGSNIDATINSIGGGWYRCRFTAQMNNGKTTLQSQVRLATANNVLTYTGDGTSGIYIFGAQLSDSASLDPYSYNFGAAPTSSVYYGPRFDYDPVTLAPKGLLIEEARTNLALNSNTFNDSIGTSENLNATTSPDGTQNASLITETTTSGEHYSLDRTIAITLGNTYVWSFYAKQGNGSARKAYCRVATAASASVIFDLTTGNGAIISSTNLVTYGSQQLSNGWWRCYIVFTAGSTGNAVCRAQLIRASDNASIYTGDGVSGLYFWGAQLEAGTFPTSYIPTTSAQVTRTADDASMVGTNFSSWYNQSEGTVAVGYDRLSNITASGYPRVYSITDGTLLNEIDALQQTGSGEYFSIYTNGTNQALIPNIVVTAGNSIKTASSYATNNVNSATNTILGVNDNLATIPSVTRLDFGNRFDGIRPLNGHIQSFKYFNKRLLNSYLQSLTQ